MSGKSHRLVRADEIGFIEIPGQTFWVPDREHPHTFMPYRLEPGAGVPVHQHQNLEERCLMQSGSLKFVVDGEELMLETGDYLYIPTNTPHGFINQTQEPVHLLWICDAGAFEQFLIAMDELVAAGAPGEEFASVAAQHDVEFVGGIPE